MMDETEIATATTTADEHVVVCDEVLLEEADKLIDECEVNMVQDILEGENGEDQLQFIVDNDGKISFIQNGIEVEVPVIATTEDVMQEIQSPDELCRYSSDEDLQQQPIIDDDMEICNDAGRENRDGFESGNLTKKGTVRKRTRYEQSRAERNEIKEAAKRKAREMKDGCGEKCKLKCHEKLNQARRTELYDYYWSLQKESRQTFVQSMVTIIPKKKNSKYLELSRRVNSVVYSFKDANNISVQVCKKFFLATLGHFTSHDHIIHHAPNTSKPKSPRENPPGRKKYDRQVIIDHIESFNPTISHYRREHAPLRRYIASDITIVKMWEDFKEKNPGTQCSYELYRTVIKDLNIAFTKLGNEECEVCEEHNIHKKGCESVDCDICIYWKKHVEHARKSRELYQRSGVLEDIPEGTIVYSVDLQKVIMLPRCDMFKSVIFVLRLSTYNESFVPVGRNNKNPAHAFIWHEAIRGRLAQDIVSTFHNFVLSNRDAKKIILWLDNCTAQNKNWALLCFLVYAVNEMKDIALQEIEINFFEPGHTFMSCDSFHHLVEKSLREKKKVYDYIDFKECVQAAKKSAIVHDMTIQHFSQWKDFSSKTKLKKLTPRPYLNQMKQMTATKGKYTITYKVDFDEEGIELDFLQKKIVEKQGFPPLEKISHERGVELKRKEAILARLIEERGAIIPPHKVAFWQSLPCAEGIEAENDIE